MKELKVFLIRIKEILLSQISGIDHANFKQGLEIKSAIINAAIDTFTVRVKAIAYPLGLKVTLQTDHN